MYVELHAHSAYSFLDGASLPEELAARAAELGYEALALTDHDGVYGSLEFAHAAKAFGVRPITGAEVTLGDGSHVTLLVESAAGYANLCRLLTAAHAHTRDGPDLAPPSLDTALLAELNDGLVCLSGCARHGLGVRHPNVAAELAPAFGPERFYVELQRPYERGDARRNAALRDLAEALGVRTVATGDAHAHHPRRTALQDVLVAIRCRTSLDGCEAERRGNRESVLLAPEEAVERFPLDRDAVERAGGGGPAARTLPQPRAGVGARHRPRLPARHPREADRRGLRALRPGALGARRQLLDLPRARRHPRRRQGARPAVRRARAARAA